MVNGEIKLGESNFTNTRATNNKTTTMCSKNVLLYKYTARGIVQFMNCLYDIQPVVPS